MGIRVRGIVLGTLLAGALAAPAEAQGQDIDFTLNVNVDLVELRVAVLDPRDRLVTTLTRDDFEIFEDQTPQRTALFRTDDLPVSLGLVIDNSRSMERKKESVDAAALSFLRQSNPEDEAFLVQFDDRARLAEDFTADVARIEAALGAMRSYGETALFDAVVMAAEKAAQGRYDQKALLVVTDGADNASTRSFDDALEAIRRTGVRVYTVAVFGVSTDRPETRAALERIAQVSGGRAFFTTRAVDIPPLTQQIARELRALYTLGYVPTNPQRDGAWRSVRVRLKGQNPENPRLRLNYRLGYYAPAGKP